MWKNSGIDGRPAAASADLAVALPLRLLAALAGNMHPSNHGGSQSCITSVPGDMTPFSGGLDAHGVHTYMQT